MKINYPFWILLTAAILMNLVLFLLGVPFKEGQVSEITAMQEKSLELLNGLSNLLIQLAIGLFAFLGYFVLDMHNKNFEKFLKYKNLIYVAFCLIALSINFGYIMQSKLVEMASIGLFNFKDKVIVIPRYLQLGLMLVAIIFSGRILFKVFETRPL